MKINQSKPVIIMCVGSALHRGTSPILSPRTTASYFIALFCPGGVAGLPNADCCYPTAASLLCGWSVGLECLPIALCRTPVAHSVLFLSSLKTALFHRGCMG